MNGTLSLITLDAPSLEGNALGDPARRTFPVYLPGGYEASGQRFPVVYFLHAFGGSGLKWINAGGWSPTVPERIDRLIASGSVPPFLAIFLDGWTALGGSQWINSAAIGAYRDYVARDVVAWADAELRTIPDAKARAILGHSSGGYGAMVMGRHHPDVFAHVGCQAGDSAFEYCYLPDFPKAAGPLRQAGGVAPWWKGFLERAQQTKLRGDDHVTINVLAMAAAYSPSPHEPLGVELPFELETGRLKPDIWDRWLAHDPVRFIPHSLNAFSQLTSLFLDAGTRDEYNLQWGTRMMREALGAGGVSLVHEEFDAGHTGNSHRFDRALAYLVPRLSRG